MHSHHCQSNCSLVLFWLIFEFFICVAWNSLPSVRCKSVKFPLSYRNIVCCLYCAILSHKVYVLDVQVLLLHVKDHTCQFDLASFFRCLKWQNWALHFLKTQRMGEIGKVGLDLNFSSTSHNPSFDGFTHCPTSWGSWANFSRLFIHGITFPNIFCCKMGSSFSNFIHCATFPNAEKFL